METFGEKQYIGVGTGSADSYPKAEARVQGGLCPLYIHYKGKGESAPRNVAVGADGVL